MLECPVVQWNITSICQQCILFTTNIHTNKITKLALSRKLKHLSISFAPLCIYFTIVYWLWYLVCTALSLNTCTCFISLTQTNFPPMLNMINRVVGTWTYRGRRASKSKTWFLHNRALTFSMRTMICMPKGIASSYNKVAKFIFTCKPKNNLNRFSSITNLLHMASNMILGRRISRFWLTLLLCTSIVDLCDMKGFAVARTSTSLGWMPCQKQFLGRSAHHQH